MSWGMGAMAEAAAATVARGLGCALASGGASGGRWRDTIGLLVENGVGAGWALASVGSCGRAVPGAVATGAGVRCGGEGASVPVRGLVTTRHVSKPDAAMAPTAIARARRPVPGAREAAAPRGMVVAFRLGSDGATR